MKPLVNTIKILIFESCLMTLEHRIMYRYAILTFFYLSWIKARQFYFPVHFAKKASLKKMFAFIALMNINTLGSTARGCISLVKFMNIKLEYLP